MPPRALEPAGLLLVDKPAGPSSFAIVARTRNRTRARTGHAGTLDPFATGLLLVLSGRATRLAPAFVGLDKRYLTTVDLRSRTDSGDPTGAAVETHPAPGRDALDAARRETEALAKSMDLTQVTRFLDLLEFGLHHNSETDKPTQRGWEIELRIPAASAVKIDGERAYSLHRRGVAVEMPLRRSTVSRLDLLAYEGGVATLDLHVTSGTYVRAIADALGGHCVTLRRTEVGPFSVDEADDERIIPVDEALARLGVAPGTL